MISEQLKRDRQKNRVQIGVAFFNKDRVFCESSYRVIISRGNCDNGAPPAFYLFHVRCDLFIELTRGRQHDHWKVLINKGYRAMLHLAGSITFSMDIRYLFQLQRAFKSDRIVYSPAEIQELLFFEKLPCERAYGGVKLQRVLDLHRQVKEVPKQL